jgi:hypothetical protein
LVLISELKVEVDELVVLFEEDGRLVRYHASLAGMYGWALRNFEAPKREGGIAAAFYPAKHGEGSIAMTEAGVMSFP